MPHGPHSGARLFFASLISARSARPLATWASVSRRHQAGQPHGSAARRSPAAPLHARASRPTEIGLLYYEKCKLICLHRTRPARWPRCCRPRPRGPAHQHLGGIRPPRAGAAGDEVHEACTPGLQIELNCEDRYVNLVEQGVDVAIRMGVWPIPPWARRFWASTPGWWWHRPVT
jgi:hypothetical protein